MLSGEIHSQRIWGCVKGKRPVRWKPDVYYIRALVMGTIFLLLCDVTKIWAFDGSSSVSNFVHFVFLLLWFFVVSFIFSYLYPKKVLLHVWIFISFYYFSWLIIKVESINDWWITSRLLFNDCSEHLVSLAIDLRGATSLLFLPPTCIFSKIKWFLLISNGFPML